MLAVQSFLLSIQPERWRSGPSCTRQCSPSKCSPFCGSFSPTCWRCGPFSWRCGPICRQCSLDIEVRSDQFFVQPDVGNAVHHNAFRSVPRWCCLIRSQCGLIYWQCGPICWQCSPDPSQCSLISWWCGPICWQSIDSPLHCH